VDRAERHWDAGGLPGTLVDDARRRRMHLTRRTLRIVAGGLSAAMATIYFLIGLGVLEVVQPGGEDLLAFGAMAGGAFVLGTALLLAFDNRWLWAAGAILQVFVFLGYFAVAPERTPAFEVWGLTLRIVQLPLFATLVHLTLRPASDSAAQPVRGGPRR
jgi:hypothetical protein